MWVPLQAVLCGPRPSLATCSILLITERDEWKLHHIPVTHHIANPRQKSCDDVIRLKLILILSAWAKAHLAKGRAGKLIHQWTTSCDVRTYLAIITARVLGLSGLKSLSQHRQTNNWLRFVLLVVCSTHANIRGLSNPWTRDPWYRSWNTSLDCEFLDSW